MEIWNDIFTTVKNPEYRHGEKFIIHGDLTELRTDNNKCFVGSLLISDKVMGDWYEFLLIDKSKFFKDFLSVMENIKIPSKCSFECTLEAKYESIKKYYFKIDKILANNEPLMFPFYICQKDNLRNEDAGAESCGYNFGRKKVDHCMLCGSTVKAIYELD